MFKVDRRDYVKSNYSAVSLAEAVRQLLPNAEVTAVAGTGVVAGRADRHSGRSHRRRECRRRHPRRRRPLGVVRDERTEGEGSDTANNDLPPQQVELIDAVTAVGKPTVAVVSMGRPYALASVIDQLAGGPHRLLRGTAPGRGAR